MKPWAEQFYASAAWHDCRDGYMQSVGGLCERCSSDDNPIAAKIVHHKVHLTKKNINDPYISLSWDNLEAVCQDCHNREHHAAERAARYTFDGAGNLQPTAAAIPPSPRKNFDRLHTERAV